MVGVLEKMLGILLLTLADSVCLFGGFYRNSPNIFTLLQFVLDWVKEVHVIKILYIHDK